MAERWLDAGLDRLQHRVVEEGDGCVRTRVGAAPHPPLLTADFTWTVDDESVLVTVRIEPSGIPVRAG